MKTCPRCSTKFESDKCPTCFARRNGLNGRFGGTETGTGKKVISADEYLELLAAAETKRRTQQP